MERMDILEKSQSYIQSNLKFSSSKLYFQHQNQILQKIGFISPMTVDIHFKYTFQEVKSEYFIEGGEFEGITVDHDVNEQGIIYKVGFLHPRFQNITNLSLNMKKNYLDSPSIWPLVKGLIGRSVIFIILLLLSIKVKALQILFWLNLIGGGIIFAFYIWKFSKFLYKKNAETKSIDYGGFDVSYSSQTDALMLSPEITRILEKLGKDFWITKICYTGNCLYLLQDVHDHEGNRLSESAKLYSEQEKAALQQKTLDFIHQPEFLSLFSIN